MNYSGVMPIIFASAIIMFFQTMLSWAGAGLKLNFLVDAGSIFNQNSAWYYIIFSLLILIFSYVWVSITFQAGSGCR